MTRPRYDDDDLPPRREIFEFGRIASRKLVRWIAWGEPCCWACRFHYGFKYNVKRSDVSWDEILRCRDRIPLQRCHIVGRSLGGSNDVSNLFLMCRECHDRMPNTSIPEIFFEWARTQSWSAREDAKIRDAMTAFRVDETTMPDLDQVLDSEDFKVWSDKIGLHWPQSNYASILSRLTPATTSGLAVYYRRTFWTRSPESQCRHQAGACLERTT